MKKILLFIFLILMFISCGKFSRKNTVKKFKNIKLIEKGSFDYEKNFIINDVDIFDICVWKFRI